MGNVAISSHDLCHVETGSIGRGQGVVKGGGGVCSKGGGRGCLMGEGGFLGWPRSPSPPLQKNKGGRGIC